MINEINDQAGQHEVVAENLTMAIAKEIVTLVKDLKDERKRVSNVCYLFIFRFFKVCYLFFAGRTMTLEFICVH